MCMSQTRRFEYKTVEIRALTFGDEGEETINDIAADGWQLKETVEVGGGSTHYIFERPT